MIRPLRAVAASVAMLVFVGCLLACRQPIAQADPETSEVVAPPPEPELTVPWPALGRSDRLDILNAGQPVDIDIPVPPGTSPGILTGLIGSAVNIPAGRVDVLDGRGALLGSIAVPVDQSSTPFTVDISGARNLGGVAALSFVLRERDPPVDSCGRLPSLTLSQLGSSFRGQTPFPATVAEFKPNWIGQILIRTGPSPTVAQQQAALELVSMFTHYYRPLPVDINVDATSSPVPPGPPTRRVIELREAAEPAMRVENPASPNAVLVISGRGLELSQQVMLFTDQRSQLAQTPLATVTAATFDAPQGATVKSFAQLRMSGEASVLGTSNLYVGFDAGEFAVGSIQQAKLRLLAHYTPVVGGEASVVLRSGSVVIGSRLLDDSGLLDMTGTIPPELIGSTVGFVLELRYLPRLQCAPLNDRMRFTLDPASTVTVTPGSRNRGGFPVLPMAFTPEFDVVVDQPEHLRYAAQVINLLGQQSSVVLRPHITTLAAVSESRLGALIVARGAELSDAGLTPPLLAHGPDTVDISSAVSTDIDLDGPVGVIQAFSDRGRMVLAIDASQDWGLVDRCLDFIRTQPSRWSSLTGDVVASGPAGGSVNFVVREGGPLTNEYPGDPWKWWAWATVAVISAALLFSGGVFLRRVRRRTGQP